MKRSVISPSISLLFSLLVLALFSGCAGTTQHVTRTVDYLYPDTKAPIVTPSVPVLTLPLRVGIAFVPGGGGENIRYGGGFHPGTFVLTEEKKMALMQEVADHFGKYTFIKDITLIPSADLTRGGSFANLDQIRATRNVDVIALLSFDQVQFTDEGAASLTYWTLIGAYIVPGEKNETHTLLDAVVYDIKSRKMLFRAPGTSVIKSSSTPVNLSEQLRASSDQGFNQAAKDMIVNLDEQLARFREKVRENPAEFKVVK